MEANQKTPTILDTIKILFQSLHTLVKQTCELAALEFQLASKSLLLILGIFFICTLLAMATWLCLLAALISWLVINFHMSLPLTILIIAFINLAMIPILFLCIAKLGQHLTFKNTRQQLGLYGNQYDESQ